MKQLLYLCSGVLLWSCGPNSLTESEVSDFAITYIESQVGGEDAVEDYIAGISETAMIWNNPVWKNKPKTFDASNVDGRVFYEDSIKVTLHDVYMMHDHANVMGTIQWYVMGTNTYYRNFSGIVTKHNGQLQWERFVGADHSQLADGFVWPSTEISGGDQAFRAMRQAMMNLDHDRALAMSDSLVEADPNWASAHLGQLQYYWFKKDVDGLAAAKAAALSKLDHASRAEEHLIRSYDPDREIRIQELRSAMMFAPNDPMIRIWYAFNETDKELARDVVQLAWNRLPQNGAVNNMMGYLYMDHLKDMDKAQLHFELFIRANPDVTNAYDSYGDFYVAQGNNVKAKEMYLKAYEMDNSWTASKEKAEALK